MQILWQGPCTKTIPSICAGCRKTGHFRKVCGSKRDHVVHELEVEVAQETCEAKIETVEITECKR